MQTLIFQTLMSLVAVGAVVALLAWLGHGRSPEPLDAERARAIAEDALPGFAGADLVLDPAATQALFHSNAHGAALVVPHGVHYRAIALTCEWTVRADAGALQLTEPEGGAQWTLELGEAAHDWAQRMRECTG